MEITTTTTQTRRVETLKNYEQKRNMLANISKNIKSIETQTQRTMKFGDNWAKRESSTTYNIDNYLTREQEFALRMENMLRETLSVYASLYALDGAMSAETYNAIVEEFEANFKSIVKTFNVQGWVLTLFHNGQFVGTKMFDNDVKMHLWFEKHLKVKPEVFTNPITVPSEYAGSILARQDWCSNPDEFFTKVKSQS